MYKSLQGSRGVAAIFVVLFHLGLTISLDKYFGIDGFSIPFLFGGAGVEYFFVLSGFIIYSAHAQDISQPQKIFSYIKKRVIRIYPAYWIVFLAVLLLFFITGRDKSSSKFDEMILLKALFLVPQEKTWEGGTSSPIIDVAWTLQYEMFFYVLFAAIILNRWLFLFLAAILCLACTILKLPTDTSLLLKFFTEKWILLFFMGMLVAFVCKDNIFSKSHFRIFLIIGVLIFSLLSFDTIIKRNFLSFDKTIPYGISSALIIMGLVGLERFGQPLLSSNWMKSLGDSSYALYLIHYPVISILCKIAMVVGLDKLGVYGAIISYVIIFSVCILLSIYFHLYIEKPIAWFFKKLDENYK